MKQLENMWPIRGRTEAPRHQRKRENATVKRDLNLILRQKALCTCTRHGFTCTASKSDIKTEWNVDVSTKREIDTCSSSLAAFFLHITRYIGDQIRDSRALDSFWVLIKQVLLEPFYEDIITHTLFNFSVRFHYALSTKKQWFLFYTNMTNNRMLNNFLGE